MSVMLGRTRRCDVLDYVGLSRWVCVALEQCCKVVVVSQNHTCGLSVTTGFHVAALLNTRRLCHGYGLSLLLSGAASIRSIIVQPSKDFLNKLKLRQDFIQVEKNPHSASLQYLLSHWPHEIDAQQALRMHTQRTASNSFSQDWPPPPTLSSASSPLRELHAGHHHPPSPCKATLRPAPRFEFRDRPP
jgi:hypothetical protein